METILAVMEDRPEVHGALEPVILQVSSFDFEEIIVSLS